MPYIETPDPDEPLPWWRIVGEPLGWTLLVVLSFVLVAGATRLLVHPRAPLFPHGISEGVAP